MNLTDLLKGRMVKLMTDVMVEVQLEIKEVKEEHHSRDLEPATQANDWWPKSTQWTTIEVTFINGYTKTYKNLEEVDIVDVIEIKEEPSAFLRTGTININAIKKNLQKSIYAVNGPNEKKFNCFEVHRPNIPDHGCTEQCSDCKEIEETKPDVRCKEEGCYAFAMKESKYCSVHWHQKYK